MTQMVKRHCDFKNRIFFQVHVESRMASILTSVSTLAGNIANTRMESHSRRRKRELSDFSKNMTIKATHNNLGK